MVSLASFSADRWMSFPICPAFWEKRLRVATGVSFTTEAAPVRSRTACIVIMNSRVRSRTLHSAILLAAPLIPSRHVTGGSNLCRLKMGKPHHRSGLLQKTQWLQSPPVSVYHRPHHGAAHPLYPLGALIDRGWFPLRCSSCLRICSAGSGPRGGALPWGKSCGRWFEGLRGCYREDRGSSVADACPLGQSRRIVVCRSPRPFFRRSLRLALI